MVSRRSFLGILAGLPAMSALAGAGLRLPRREEVAVTLDTALAETDKTSLARYFTSKETWYLDTSISVPTYYRHPDPAITALIDDFNRRCERISVIPLGYYGSSGA